MRIVVTVEYKEWMTVSDTESTVAAKSATQTFEDTATLAEVAQYLGLESNEAIRGTVVVKISPDGGSWPYERYKTHVG